MGRNISKIGRKTKGILCVSSLALIGLVILFFLLPSEKKNLEPSYDESPVPFDEDLEKAKATDVFRYYEILHPSKRFLVYLSTDKQIYRNEETVYIRGVFLNAFTHSPLSPVDLNFVKEEIRKYYKPVVSLYNSIGKEEYKFEISDIEDSVLSFKWKIPKEQRGGTYTIRIKFGTWGNDGSRGSFFFVDSSEKQFEIRQFVAERYKKSIEFLKSGYVPNEKVEVVASFTKAEGGFPDKEKSTFSAIAVVDGNVVFENYDLNCDERGELKISFYLPGVISKNEGYLTVKIEEGIVESVTKSIPVVLKQFLNVRLFPEGGNFVAGLENGVYIEVLDDKDDHVDFSASLIKGNDVVVIKDITNIHEGRASFDFFHEKGRAYKLVFSSPVKQIVNFPTVIGNSGITLRIKNKKSFKHNEDIVVSVGSTFSQKLYVGLYKKEQFIDMKKVVVDDMESKEVSFVTKKYDGVLRITVFNQNLAPQAERIVFVHPKEEIVFEVQTDKDQYIPGDKVSLLIKSFSKSTRKYLKEKVSVGIVVTDDSTFEMTNRRERNPRLFSQVFLESEVEDNRPLFDSNGFLEPSDNDLNRIDPSIRLDLLMGTQGWRKFIYRGNLGYGDLRRGLKKILLFDAERFGRMFYEHPPRSHRNNFYDEFVLIFFIFFLLYILAGICCGWEKICCGKCKMNWCIALICLLLFVYLYIQMNTMYSGRYYSMISPSVHVHDSISYSSVESDGSILKSNFDRTRDVNKKNNKKNVGFVRVFAQRVKTDKLGVRSNFEDTLFYSSSLDMNEIGEKRVDFYLNDAVTSFRVFVDGYSTSGIIGSSQGHLISSKKPFFIEPNVPSYISTKDDVEVDVLLVNNIHEELKVEVTVRVVSSNDEESVVFLTPEKNNVILQSMERKKVIFKMKVSDFSHVKHKLNFVGKAKLKGYDLIRDEVLREVSVISPGYPFIWDFSSRLEPNAISKTVFSMPKSFQRNTVTTETKVYVSPLSSMTEGIKSLIRQPHGCFEQVTSTLFPMIMAKQYIKTHEESESSYWSFDEIKARKYLESGYSKLLSYEKFGGGFSMFGRGEPSEYLTALGIMQFKELSTVYTPSSPSIESVIKRSIRWLLSRKKNFMKNPFYTSYIIYSLSSTGIVKYEDVNDVVESLLLKSKGDSSFGKDSNFLGFLALSLFNFGKISESKEIVNRLVDYQDASSGAFTSSKLSLTKSSGISLRVETTGIGVLNFLNFLDSFQKEAELGVKFLQSRNQNGGFGSTQSTVLALKAIIAYDELNKLPANDGIVKLFVNDKVVSKKKIVGEYTETLYLDNFSQQLQVGKDNKLHVQMIGGSAMSFSMQIRMFVTDTSLLSTSIKVPKLSFNVLVEESSVREGEVKDIKVVIKNLQNELSSMAIAVVSIPIGLKVDYENLKEMKRRNIYDFFELSSDNSEIVFYWEGLKKEEKVSFSIRCIANMRGVFHSKASYALFYYENESIYFAKSFFVEVSE